MRAIELQPLWTAEDVAQYLKASRSWVYGKSSEGVLPSLHVGGLLRFEPDVIRAFARGEFAPATTLVVARTRQ